VKLAAKLNLVLGLIFSFGLVLTASVMYLILERNAEEEVLERAALMMESATAVRSYTVNEIRPLLFKHMAEEFLPQTVPAYAATQAFETLRKSQADYTYKEATLNPTNPRDRAVAWEADVVEQFRNHEDSTELVGHRETPTGESLYLARPIRITNPGCLVCHSVPSEAPASMIKKYGTANGFGWELNEVVGAQIVSVPTSLPRAKAQRAFLVVMGLVLAGFILIIIVLNVMLRKIVVSPATQMSDIATQVSRGQLDAPALPEGKGEDEISTLAQSFNRMRRSLEKAMKMLES
jgi:HAMP domain-containing protein